MKNRATNNRVFKSVAEFQKEFLPAKYKARKERKDLDARSLGIQMARDIVASVRTSAAEGRARRTSHG